VFLRQRERGQRHDEIVSEQAPKDDRKVPAVNPLWSAVERSDPEGEFFEAIVDETILDAIEKLPEEYRMAVVLSDLEGLSYNEIAEMIGVPVGTVKSRLFRGRRQLQQELFGYAVEMGYLPGSPSENEEE
jgi:RNA polymerase sigma factor (sigma-70 family)